MCKRQLPDQTRRMMQPNYVAYKWHVNGYWYVQRVDVKQPYLVRAATGEPYRFANKKRAANYAKYLMGETKKITIAPDTRATPTK
jgi:hypothetical protein